MEAGAPYALSLYLRVPRGSAISHATVALLPADAPTNKHNRSSTGLAAPLAAARFSGLTAEWQQFTAELVSPTTDLQARLTVRRCGHCWQRRCFLQPGVAVASMASLHADGDAVHAPSCSGPHDATKDHPSLRLTASLPGAV